MKMLPWKDMALRFGDAVRYRLITLGILIVGAVLMTAAIGFAVAGGFMWLSSLMPGYLAALSVAGMLCLLGMLVVAVAAGRGGNKIRMRDEAPDKMAGPDFAPDQIVHAVLSAAADKPVQAIAAATVLGFVVGLLRPKS